jgi:excisionase family DNA binding protein
MIQFPAMEARDSLLTTRQLQDLLQIDRITIYRMLSDGRLEGFKVGGQWRFSRKAVESWLQRQRILSGMPKDPQANYDLDSMPGDLPWHCIQAIQGVFAEALGLGAVTTAVDGTPLTLMSNSCEFCSLILSTETGRQRCIASWQAAAAEASQGVGAQHAESLATCHAGLMYVCGTVVVRGQPVAAIHAGQFLAHPPNKGRPGGRIVELANVTGLNPQDLDQALAGVPVLDPERSCRVPSLLARLTSAVSQIGEERLNLLGRLQRIAEISRMQKETDNPWRE